MTLQIRTYHPSDLPALYRICLQTGASGEDATHLYSDPDLLGHYYLGPYLVAEPELAFVLALERKPIGYIVGARDSAAFGRWCEAAWFPHLRTRYPLSSAEQHSQADQTLIQAIHRGHETVNHWPEYPAHLHIDILPEGRGKGMGRQLMNRLCQTCVDLNVAGIHLGVDKANTNAIHFYRHIGFKEIASFSWGYVLGMNLS